MPTMGLTYGGIYSASVSPIYLVAALLYLLGVLLYRMTEQSTYERYFEA